MKAKCRNNVKFLLTSLFWKTPLKITTTLPGKTFFVYFNTHSSIYNFDTQKAATMNIPTPSSPSNSALANLQSQDLDAFGEEHENENIILDQTEATSTTNEGNTGTTTPVPPAPNAATPSVPPAPNRLRPRQETGETPPAAQRPRISRPDTADTEIAFQFTINLTRAPVNHAYDALRAAIDPLPVVPDDKKEVISKKFSSLLLKIHKKDTNAKRFDNADWIPKPIRLKTFIAAPDLADTEFVRKITEEEMNLQSQYVSKMRDLMHKLAKEQLKNARLALLDELVNFTRNLVRAYDAVYPSESGDSLGNVDYVAYDAIRLYNTEKIQVEQPDGTFSTSSQQRQLMYTLFSGMDVGSALLQRLNLSLRADATSFNENKRAHTASKYVKRVLRSSIFTAHAAFQANLEAADKKIELAAIYQTQMTEAAAENMETEFDNAIGPAQNEVVNKATRDLIQDENEKLRREIESLKKAVKNDKRGATKKTTSSAASKKKSKSEKDTKSTSASSKASSKKSSSTSKKNSKKAKKAKGNANGIKGSSKKKK